MPATERKIVPADIIAYQKYAAERSEFRKNIVAMKKNRRVEVGPFVTFYFENYDTMWLQVQEMLHIEKGGEAQLPDELQAYNPLIPQGSELIATLMIEIDDPQRRDRELYRLAGIEESTYIALNQERIPGIPTEYDERTTPDGKTSSVHWVRFKFIPEQLQKFKTTAVEIVLGLAHPAYSHMAVIMPDVRNELAKDFAP
ncbi:MAG: DUF3501 family protein [Alphaproteobacteria bacterium]|nr:DUF3501 family protein [Alphaproteobacteria bacterium]MBV9061635.1 DUF3501 family protein [Alphaproteobacteria bacterium]MBV9913177.1 DUF3501 family protein [Nevskiaceae bacterium]